LSNKNKNKQKQIQTLSTWICWPESAPFFYEECMKSNCPLRLPNKSQQKQTKANKNKKQKTKNKPQTPRFVGREKALPLFFC